MKANAPEKLYVDVQDDFDDSFLYGFIEKSGDEDIEYTHTDAFIEKAVSYIQQHWIWNTKMLEDFKNYMKGE